MTETDALTALQQQIAQLQAEQALQTLALRQILEAKLTGADGAAGTVVELEGGQTSLTVTLGNSSGA